jgi:Pentatricopeptide repeat domain
MSTYHDMAKLGLTPNMATYNTLLGGLDQSVGIIEEAENVLHEMHNHGFEPNNITYDI